jgi:hypothetical protein
MAATQAMSLNDMFSTAIGGIAPRGGDYRLSSRSSTTTREA